MTTFYIAAPIYAKPHKANLRQIKDLLALPRRLPEED
jgi:hypothetical protein